MIESNPQISVEYGGNLATRMIWHEDILAEFARRSDLRSRIVIREGSETSNHQITTLGNVLAMRRTFDFLPKRASQTPEMSVDFNLYQNLGTVKINHHVLTERLTNQRKFDVNTYVKEVDRLTQAGLRKVLAGEKISQTAFSVMADSLLGCIALISGAPGLFLIKDSLERMASRGNIIISVGEGLVGGTLLGITTLLGISYIYINSHPPGYDEDDKDARKMFNPVFPYVSQKGDLLLPFKHMGGFMRGNLYMRGKKVVELTRPS